MESHTQPTAGEATEVHEEVFKILTLDGGGAKGLYSLGFLEQVEATAKRPLCDLFDMVYGTSTGAIIAGLIGMGLPVAEIKKRYLDHVPTVMRPRFSWSKSRALEKLADTIFESHTFEDLKTYVGIVSTNWYMERPLIFKSSVRGAYSSKDTFKPGFGCTLADAIRASCAAAPFFQRVHLQTANYEQVDAVDGGYCANNPTLFAISDALTAFGNSRGSLRVLSVGVGHYPQPPQKLMSRILNRLPSVQLLQKTLSVNATSMETLARFLFPDIQLVRVNNRYTEPHLATDFLEHDSMKLNRLYQLGRQSYESFEVTTKSLLGI